MPQLIEDLHNKIVDAPVSLEEMDYGREYSDEFYSEYIESFVVNTKSKIVFRFLKRLGDVLLSGIALLLLWPVMLGIAIAVRCDSKGPIVFKQKRVGRYGELFNCLKFRSMRTDAPKNAPTSLLENPEQYYTRVGRFLRKTSLDELPQLWCVFIGKMSIIGYRPLVPNEEKANKMRERLGVFEMRPGISGLAQVKGRDDVYYKNKALLDAEYVKKASIWLDIKLILQTVMVVLGRKGNKSNSKSAEKELLG